MNLAKDMTIRFSVVNTRIIFNGLDKDKRTMVKMKALPTNRPIQFPDGEVIFIDGKNKDDNDSELEIEITVADVDFDNGVYGFLTYQEYWGAHITLSASKSQVEQICNLVANDKKIEDITICVRDIKNESTASQMLEMKTEQYEIEYWEFSILV